MIYLIQAEAQGNGWLSSATISLLVLVRVSCNGEIVNSHFHCRVFPNNIRSKAQKNKVQIAFKSLLRRDANTFILEKSLEMHACTLHIV